MQAWQLFLTGVAGWMNRKHLQVIEYLLEENRLSEGAVGQESACAFPRARSGVWQPKPGKSALPA